MPSSGQRHNGQRGEANSDRCMKYSLENYGTTAEQGHHRELLEAICERIGGAQGLLDRAEALMEARNRKYAGAGRTTQDATDAVKVMDEFLAFAETWIKPKIENLTKK